MGRAIRGTKVKVDGQAGPLGKGMPLTQAAGPGGAATRFGPESFWRGSRAIAETTRNMKAAPQVPGYKGLMERARAAGRFPGKAGKLWETFGGKVPANTQGYGGKPLPEKLRGGFFGKVFNQLSQRQAAPMPGGGLFRNRQFAQLAPQVQPSGGTTRLAPPAGGGLTSKPLTQPGVDAQEGFRLR